MITKAILNVVFGLLGTLLSLLPPLDFPFMTDISNGIKTLIEFIGKADAFIPVDTILIVLGACVSIPLFKMMFFVINWIIRRIADVIP